jgi:hypothetical protein
LRSKHNPQDWFGFPKVWSKNEFYFTPNKENSKPHTHTQTHTMSFQQTRRHALDCTGDYKCCQDGAFTRDVECKHIEDQTEYRTLLDTWARDSKQHAVELQQNLLPAWHGKQLVRFAQASDSAISMNQPQFRRLGIQPSNPEFWQ